MEGKGYNEGRIRYALSRMSQKQRVDAFCMLVYLQWKSGTAGENVSMADVLHGAWVFHIFYPLKSLKRTIERANVIAPALVFFYFLFLLWAMTQQAH